MQVDRRCTVGTARPVRLAADHTGRGCRLGGTTHHAVQQPRRHSTLERTQRAGQRALPQPRPRQRGDHPGPRVTVREVETAVKKGQLSSGTTARYQVVALLAREERAKVKADTTLTDAQRDGQLKRLDGIATILAKTAAHRARALRSARRGRRGLRGDPPAAAGDAAPGRLRARAGARGGRGRRGRPPRAPGGPAVGDGRASWPTRSWRPTSPGARRAPRARWSAGSCSARCSAPSSTPPPVHRRAWTCPSRGRCCCRPTSS